MFILRENTAAAVCALKLDGFWLAVYDFYHSCLILSEDFIFSHKLWIHTKS